MDSKIFLTRMAGGPTGLETNDDLAKLLDQLVADPVTRVIFMNAAVCDFNGIVGDHSGKYGDRLKTANGEQVMQLLPADKLIANIRKNRKDIFLVGFKTTTNASEDEQYIAGLDLCKKAGCNLVLANDTITRKNMIVTPEEARYNVTKNREEVLDALVDMTWHRTHLNFTRSTVVDGKPVPWESTEVPSNLRAVVNYCIEQNAYKPFNGVTAGHFACKIDDTTFLSSIRKTNFNDLHKTGLVRVKTDGPDSVIAYGAKPSVGGQSQRIVFQDHSDYDCIVHFHCPIKPDSEVPTVSQREVECGSHQCGSRTSKGLKKFGNLSAVYLDQHGPNIVFHRSTDPQEVINFIEDNFDLSQKTGGYVSLEPRILNKETAPA
jgi:ribulose-5-phosphate 4-epimerase/fuculose-1-phosphate aldolase